LPIPDWRENRRLDLVNNPQCKKFINFSTNNTQFQTDGLLVIKDGQILFEYYKSPYSINKPHALWSMTKTLTAILLGMAVRDGRIDLDNQLDNYFPSSNRDNNYKKIVIKNLIYLDSGFIWNENDLDLSKNNSINMLFGKGHKNMTKYALSKKIIKEGPEYKWNYSSGSPTITMGVLKEIYDGEYNLMPWRNLAYPLGINELIFEQDSSGTFVGGALAYLTPRDMAKIGYLMLQNGFWNGELLLPTDWISKMLTPSNGYLSPGTVIENISDVGVYGGGIWLNRAVKNGFGKPYPASPDNMFLAIGFLGQLMIVLPDQKMIIVRMGHDLNMNSKIDRFASLALSCFDNPQYKVAKDSHQLNKRLGIKLFIKNIRTSFHAKIFQGSLAKILCSCHYVSKNTFEYCLEENHFDFSKLFTKIRISEEKDKNGIISIEILLSRFAKLFGLKLGLSPKAYYNPKHSELGCFLN